MDHVVALQSETDLCLFLNIKGRQISFQSKSAKNNLDSCKILHYW